jgi:hypothetical protein
VFALGGCASVTPQKIPVDRLEYGQVLADSWKRQTLLNVVRLRYGDAPMFLDVASVINSYSYGSKAIAKGQFPSRIDPNVLEFSSEGTWSNTPTVTYQPLMGARFTTSLLQPVAPSWILRLVQSGWSVDLVLRTVLRSVNGLRNASSSADADPRFDELVETLGRIQAAGGLDTRVRPQKDGTALLMVLPDDPRDPPSLRSDRARLASLLGVRSDATELEVVYGRSAQGDAEIAMLTRSMLELMLELGFDVELPAGDVRDGSALAGRGRPVEHAARRHVRVRSGEEAPADAYAAVSYRSHWFWIDDNDIGSKSVFTFLLILFSLAETGQPAVAPLVTVPSR